VTLRRIGLLGTLARLALGVLLVGSVADGHIVRGFHPLSWVAGLLVFPALVLVVHWLRVRRNPDAFFNQSRPSAVANVGLFAALYFVPATSDATLIFYGTSMVLGAVRGYTGCEVLAISNALLGRDDQIGCAVFGPIDLLERRWKEANAH